MHWIVTFQAGEGAERIARFSEFLDEAEARKEFARVKEEKSGVRMALFLIRGVTELRCVHDAGVTPAAPDRASDCRGVYPRQEGGAWYVFSDHPRCSGWLRGWTVRDDGRADYSVSATIAQAHRAGGYLEAAAVARAMRLETPWDGTVPAPAFVPYASVLQREQGGPFVIRLFSDVGAGYLSERFTDLSLTPPRVHLVAEVEKAALYTRQEDARASVQILHNNRSAWNAKGSDGCATSKPA